MAHPSAFARLPLNQPAESIGGLYKDLVKENLGHVRAFLCEAEFWDVGTPADYLERACRSAGPKATCSQVGQRSVVERSAHVTDSVIWDDVSVGAGATLERCIVADGVQNSLWSQLQQLRHHSERRRARSSRTYEHG